MSVQESFNILQEKIKIFQDIAKQRIFNLGKFRTTIINQKNQEEETNLAMGLYFLRNSIKELQQSNVKLKDFNNLHKSIKRIFQKFIDTKELINFDKGEDLFKKLNENDSISAYKPLFCDLFQTKIKNEIFKDKCNELKESVRNFNKYKEKFKEVNSKIRYFEALKEKFDRYQNLLNKGDIESINEEKIENFRIFRSFFPFDRNSEYLIDIINQSITKILEKGS